MELLNPWSSISFNFFFNFRFNRASISCSGLWFDIEIFKVLWNPNTKSRTFFFNLHIIGHNSVVQVLWFNIEIFKKWSPPWIGVLDPWSSIIFIFFFNFRFNPALMVLTSCSGTMVRHRNFQSLIASLNRCFGPLKQHFI